MNCSERSSYIRGKKQYKIAVTSMDGMHVDQQVTHATQFLIYLYKNNKFIMSEVRSIDSHCENFIKCEQDEQKKEPVIKTLADCHAILTMHIGRVLQKKFLQSGILVLEYCHTIDSGLSYAVTQLNIKDAM